MLLSNMRLFFVPFLLPKRSMYIRFHSELYEVFYLAGRPGQQRRKSAFRNANIQFTSAPVRSQSVIAMAAPSKWSHVNPDAADA